MFRTKHKVHHGKFVYVKRNSKGQIVDVQNIGKAIRADSRIRSDNKPSKPGQGYSGDYSAKRKVKRRTPQYSGVFGRTPSLKW